MKALQLTKEQQEKLTEMCEKLFPEYFKWELVLNENVMGFKNDDPHKQRDVCIHWFEFCTLYIAPKLLSVHQSLLGMYLTNAVYYKGKLFNSAVHPIDYLYEEFEKQYRNKKGVK